MWSHFANLLQSSWRIALAKGSSTGISVFWLGLGAIILGFAVTILIEWVRGGCTMNSLKDALKSWPPYVGAASALILVWTMLYVWTIVTTIYEDHQGMVKVVTDKNGQLTEVASDRDQWKKKFESVSPVPPKVIIRTPEVSEPEKRCWLSNIAGMPNSKIAGAVTANEAVIRCNFRIEAPYDVKLQFDRDFIPGAVLPIDSRTWSFGPTNVQGNMLISRIDGPALLSNQLVVVTVYGRTDQYPKAVKGVIEPAE